MKKFIGSSPNKDSKFNFSYDGVMRSFEDSLQRLQLDHVDVLHLHDPDNHPDHFNEAKNGAIWLWGSHNAGKTTLLRML